MNARIEMPASGYSGAKGEIINALRAPTLTNRTRAVRPGFGVCCRDFSIMPPSPAFAFSS